MDLSLFDVIYPGHLTFVIIARPLVTHLTYLILYTQASQTQALSGTMLALTHYFPTLLLGFSVLTSAASFPRLYVSSYDGNVTTLVLTHDSSTSYEYGRPTITTTSCNLTALSRIPCAADPSWLTFDSRHHRLYCIGEDLLGKTGGLTVFETLPNGELKTLSTTNIGPGAVNSVLHGGLGNASGSDLVLAN